MFLYSKKQHKVESDEPQKILTFKSWLLAKFLAFFTALAQGVQNFMGFLAFLADICSISWQASLGLAITLGGFFSGLVNLPMMDELLNEFFCRFNGKKPAPSLAGWRKFRYWAGSVIFIITGLLFGLTAFAFGPAGGIAAIGIITGLMVAVIMTIEELETWLSSFDEEEKKVSVGEALITWFKSLTPGKTIGLFIALGNVVALSLLFTFGLTTFLTGIGVPLLPALIAGFSLAFTAGAFTEFYFYNHFLASYCDKFWDKIINLIYHCKYTKIGILSVTINGFVNGALCYAGVILLAALMTTAGLAAPPLGVAILMGLIGGLTSMLLGSDFWTKKFGLPVTDTSENIEKEDITTQTEDGTGLTNDELSQEEAEKQTLLPSPTASEPQISSDAEPSSLAVTIPTTPKQGDKKLPGTYKDNSSILLTPTPRPRAETTAGRWRSVTTVEPSKTPYQTPAPTPHKKNN